MNRVAVVPKASAEARRPASASASAPSEARRKSTRIGIFVESLLNGPNDCVVLDPVAFFLAWTGIYALHFICAAYLISAGMLYKAFPATQVGNMFLLYLLTLDPSYFPLIARVHYSVAVIHLFFPLRAALRMLYKVAMPHSAQSRVRSMRASLSDRLSTVSSISTTARRATQCSLAQYGYAGYHWVCALGNRLTVHGSHFELFFLFREVVATVLQTHQAYNMSRLLPRVTLNRFYTVILILNCWTTPLVKRVFHKNKSLELLLCVLCNLALDLVSSIVVPVAVALTYLSLYDTETTDFADLDLWYDDVFLLNIMNEAPLVLFDAWLDALSRLLFSLGVLSSIQDAKALIKKRLPSSSPSPPARLSTGWLPSAIIPTYATTAPTPKPALYKMSTISTCHRHRSNLAILLENPNNRERLAKWVHRLLILWGIGIASVFLDALFRSPPGHCALEMRSWLVRNPACAVVEINCLTDSQILGTESDNDKIFSELDAGSVEHVMYRHCAQVEIPSGFQKFRNLYGFKTHNSTITSWPRTSALTTQSHPRVRFAFFTLTNFPNATLPAGLVDPDFPKTLYDLEISVSNIQFLPQTLPWPQTMTIYLEFGQLQEFPMVLSDLKPYTLSLAYNNISDFPADAIMTPDIAKFTLRGNPIVKLPETGVNISQLHATGSGVELWRIDLQQTQISSLPLWVNEEFMERISLQASASPICVEVLQNLTSPERELLRIERPWLVDTVDCESDPGIQGLYPLYLDTRVDGT